MSHQIPYEDGTYRPDDSLIPNNTRSDNPVEFGIAPAGGSDLARLKSVLYASAGLTNEGIWSPDMQAAVIGAFETGADVFTRCVTWIRGFTVPAALAVRVGLLQKVPAVADADGKVRPDPKAPIPITTGAEFSKVAGFQTALSLGLAFEIMKISRQVNTLDARLFVQPSGSSSPGTPDAPTGSVTTAQKRHGRRETAGS